MAMKSLTKKRGTYKAQLSTLLKFINKIEVDDPVKACFNLEYKVERMEELLEKYNGVYEEITELVVVSEVEGAEEMIENIEEDRATFINSFLDVKYLYSKKIKELKLQLENEHSGSEISFNTVANSKTIKEPIETSPDVKKEQIETQNKIVTSTQINDAIRLPKISLPTFDGDIEQWLGFRDTFRDLIIENSSISEIQKYYYLNGMLKGDARRTISNIEFSAGGFQLAWEALIAKYDDKKLILENHLQLFFNLKSMVKESKSEIVRIHDESQKHLRALKKLGVDIDEKIIVYIIKQKFDVETKKMWENEDKSQEYPSAELLFEFIHRRCRALSCETSNKVNTINNRKNVSVFVASEDTSNLNCTICKGNHYINKCQQFLDLTMEKRLEKINDLRLCINCFGPNHRAFYCRKQRCKKCHKSHNILLHFTKSTLDHNNSTSSKQDTTPESTSTNLHCRNKTNQVILSTVQIFIADSSQILHECRALLDSASETNFISKELADKLNLKGEIVNLQINGIDTSTAQSKQKISVNIKSKLNEFSAELQCYVVSQICNNLPNCYIDYNKWNLPSNIHLADDKFNIPGKVDLILGAELFYKIIKSGKLVLNEHLPILQETEFGWVVGGKLNMEETQNFFVSGKLESEDSDLLIDLLHRFWTMESCTTNAIQSPEEVQCERIFEETYKRDENGCFIVHLPIKDNVSLLGESRTTALKRLYYLESRFKCNPILKEEYVKFMREYEHLGHMVKCNSTPTSSSSIKTFYLPHHAVLKPSSSTTKLRVVFDASAKSSSKLSLNDVLMTGPTVQNDLFTVILKFRTFKYVLITDVEKMFRQIKVVREHTPLQRILWREKESDDVLEFELVTVTYGTSCAPYLATKSLIKLANEGSKEFPYASNAVLNNSYVDDILTGADTLDVALKLQQELINLFKSANMNLKKWISNEPKLLEGIPVSDREIIDDTNKVIKTLGLRWDNNKDCFNFVITCPEHINKNFVTKRELISFTARSFDPLGFIAPVIVIPKILIQRVWLAKIDWDDPIPIELQTIWNDFCKQLPMLNNISIPRTIDISIESVTIHGFSDASSIAFGACVYVRYKDTMNNIVVRLIASKSRVLPLNSTTIPRAELNAAQLLANLVVKVTNALNIHHNYCFLWTDSSIVLAWLKLTPCQLKVYVGNRVSEILQLTSKMSWRHVSSKMNAADVLSRGILPSEFVELTEWFNGPEFLLKEKEEWPSKFIQPSVIPERRENILSFMTKTEIHKFDEVINFNKYSSFRTIVRIIAWCKRFYNNIHVEKQLQIRSKCLSVNEIENASVCLFKVLQRDMFYTEIQLLSSGRELDTRNSIINLNPYIDCDGLIRVGGRLDHSKTLSYDQKHQILLKDHYVVNLLIRQTHQMYLHTGIQQTLSILRQKYWIINGKRLVKRVVHSCIPCVKINPKTMSQLMGNLPESRYTLTYPFSVTGVDFCGPFSVRYKNQRKATYVKVYICIFVCFSSKAVHLEVCEDATSNTFINCLKRFFARKGKPTVMWSDNGSNFIGAYNQLKDIKKLFNSEGTKIENFCVNSEVRWNFIPPRSPHFGGIWESGVKTIKTHMKKVVGSQLLTLEQLYTLVVEIEGVMNSRPLWELSSDANDLQPLTPSHFLIGRVPYFIPSPNLNETPSNRLNQWQLITKMLHQFKRRFQLEYINTLQQRSKWLKNKDSVMVGKLVLVKDDSMVNLQWILGRVIKVFRGTDDKVRCVEVLTKNGTIKRAITNIAELPTEEQQLTN